MSAVQNNLTISQNISEYFAWIFQDTTHPILVCVYPRSAGKTFASFDWMMSRILTDDSMGNADAMIFTKDIPLIKSRFKSIIKTKYSDLVMADLLRMNQITGQVDFYLDKKDKFPFRSIHTATYNQREGGLGQHDKYIVCDEAGNMPRALWNETLRPIAIQDIDNGSQFLLVGTPKGMDNVFYDLYQQGQSENDFVKSVRKTCYDLNYSQHMINFMKNTGTESSFRTELLCDFSVSSFYGNIYAATVEELERNGQISDDFSYNPQYPVNIAFDLGFNDPTACWFWQYINDKIFFIEYLEVSNKYFRDIVREDIRTRYQSNYEFCIMPHDATAHHHSGGGSSDINVINDFSSLEQDTSFGVARAQGWKTFRLPKIHKLDATALNPVRSFMRYCFFNATKCSLGLRNLKSYAFTSVYSSSSDTNRICTDLPEKHGPHLHACDAFRYVAYSKSIWTRKTQTSSAQTSSAQTMFGQMMSANVKQPTDLLFRKSYKAYVE